MAATDRNQPSAKHVIDKVDSTKGTVGGRIEMSEDVVSTIAGLAAREVKGIHALGKSRLIRFGDSPTRGVAAEVGQTEAALDLEIIIEHGCNVTELADEVRRKISEQVNRMAGRQVVEVNLDVVGVHLPEDDKEPAPPKQTRRVQ